MLYEKRWGQYCVDGNLNSQQSFYCGFPKHHQIGSEVKNTNGQGSLMSDHAFVRRTLLPSWRPSIMCVILRHGQQLNYKGSNDRMTVTICKESPVRRDGVLVLNHISHIVSCCFPSNTANCNCHVERGIEARTILKRNSEKVELEGIHCIHVAQNKAQVGLL